MKFFRILAVVSAMATLLAACSNTGTTNGLPPTFSSGAKTIRHRMGSTRTDGSPCGQVSWTQNNDPESVDYGACWDDGGSSISGCVIGCNSGYPTGGGSPIGAGGAGSGCLRNPDNCVATAGPAVGLPCDGSAAHGIQIVLGTSNLPGGTNGIATSVVNIYSVQNANDYVAGWVYKTENGDYFWEGNPNSLPVFDQFAQAIPVFGSAINGFMDAVNSPRQVSLSDLQTIVKASSSGSFHQHHCFSYDLPKSQLGA